MRREEQLNDLEATIKAQANEIEDLKKELSELSTNFLKVDTARNVANLQKKELQETVDRKEAMRKAIADAYDKLLLEKEAADLQVEEYKAALKEMVNAHGCESEPLTYKLMTQRPTSEKRVEDLASLQCPDCIFTSDAPPISCGKHGVSEKKVGPLTGEALKAEMKKAFKNVCASHVEEDWVESPELGTICKRCGVNYFEKRLPARGLQQLEGPGSVNE